MLDLPNQVIFGMECKDERGRRRSDWCYKLLAIRSEGWDEFFAFMSTVGAIDRDRGYVARLMAQRLAIPDVLATRHTWIFESMCPMVDVTVFGIDSNKRAVYVEPAKRPPLDKPKVRSAPPDPVTVELVNKILSNDPEPYKATDLRLMETKVASMQQIINNTTKKLIV
jgi:hypothetical protein